jgi:hypothetical protein
MKKLTVIVFALAVSVFVVAPALEAHAANTTKKTTSTVTPVKPTRGTALVN